MNADDPRTEDLSTELPRTGDPRTEDSEETFEEAGGDPACWAGLVCQECGAVIAEGHRPGCPSENQQTLG